jgi:D-alanyl-D-alanine carboxypeptidase
MHFDQVPNFVAALFAIVGSLQGLAQEDVRTRPMPEIRALADEAVQALNDKTEAWERFAQRRFTTSLLERMSREERAQLHGQLRADLGRIALDRVIRQGPEAPIELHVTGEQDGAVIELTLEGEPAALRIAGLRVRLGAEPRERDPDRVPPPPVDGSLGPEEIKTRLGNYFATLAADGVFSGVALVARSGQPVFFEAYGLANREQGVANTTRTRFNIGSITKAFTQVAIRQLVQAGRLALTDTLGAIFPDYPQEVSRAATIAQLLAHRGGLGEVFGPEFMRAPKSRFASNADYFAFVSSLPPLFAPGERTQYCNGCYIALGAIIEKVAGVPYERYIAEQVFARAGMTRSGFLRTDRPEPDIAIGYTRPRGGAAALQTNVDLHGVAGSAAGGSYSTASDLLAFVQAVRSGVFPWTDHDFGIAGGAPGVNAVIEARGEWIVIVLSNLDPPAAEQIGSALAEALRR